MKIKFVQIIICFLVLLEGLGAQSTIDVDLIKSLAKRDTVSFLKIYGDINPDSLNLLENKKVSLIYDHVFRNDNEKLDTAGLKMLLSELTDEEVSTFKTYPRKLINYCFRNKQLYYKITEIGHVLKVDEYSDAEDHMYYLLMQSTFSGMISDFNQMSNVIQRLGKIDYSNDSMSYGTYILQKAIFAKQQKLDSVEYYFTKVIDLESRYAATTEDSMELVTSFRSFADYLYTKGDISQSAKLLHDAYNYKIPGGKNFVGEIEILFVLSSIYIDLGNLDLAEQYIFEANSLAESINAKNYRNGKCATYYGDLLMLQGKYEEAIEEYKKSFEIYSDNWIRKHDPKRAVLNLALANLAINRIEESQVWFNKNFNYKADDKVAKFLSHLYQVNSTKYQGQYRLAFRYAKDALFLARELKSKSKEKQILKILFDLNKSLNNIEQSLSYFEDYIELDKSLYRSGQELAVQQLQIQYEIDLREEKIQALNAKNNLTNSKLQAQSRFTFLSLGGLIIVTILLFILNRMVKRLQSQNEIISKADSEKKILLQEIHHRVKNNLQIISSLLKLQSRYIEDESAIKAIAEGRTRVQSMALLHQNLYKEENLTGVDMKVYFENLVQGLFDAYNIDPERISLVREVEELILDIDTVIPLGLITNELISNALKHAFPVEEKGQITVKLKEFNGLLELEVSDNGKGDSSTSKSSGFGSMLIDSLANKLEAQVHKTVKDGTTYRIFISDYKKAG